MVIRFSLRGEVVIPDGQICLLVLNRPAYVYSQRAVTTPTHIGKYHIVRPIGRGATGIVYEGFDPLIQRRVAIKTLRLEHFDQPQIEAVRTRFIREAQSAGKLAHPNIVVIHDYGEHAGAPYIVMELLTGRELSQVLAKGTRLPLSEVARLMAQLLGALAYAHGQKMIHRDIKPGNIFVLDDGSLKVVDFGLVHVEASSLTDSGALLGTPAYMSPEQFLSLPVDERSDIFSAGVILYELLTGEKPFTGSVTTIMQKVLRQDPIEPSVLNPTIPSVWDILVRRAMAKKPAERFQSARQFSETIKQVIAKGAQELAGEPTLTEGNSLDQSQDYEPSREHSNQLRPDTHKATGSVSLRPSGTPKKGRILLASLAAVLIAGAGLLFTSRRVSDEVPANADRQSAQETTLQGLGPFEDSLKRLKECPGAYSSTTWTNCRAAVVSANGATFVGSFKNGEFEGAGRIRYPDGRMYLGEWRNGLYHGQGTFVAPDGLKYVGEFFEDRRNGQGTLTWPDGASFTGSFKNGEYHGRGIQNYADGSRFEGEYRNGDRNGPGAEYGRDGKIRRSGVWAEGVFVEGKGVIRLPARKEHNG